VTAETTDKKEGTASADIVMDGAFTTQLAAYINLSATVNLSSIDSIVLWAKSSTLTASGDIEIVVDDTAGCGSVLENIGLPVLIADAWTSVTLPITDNSDMTAIKCVELNVAVDGGAQTVNLDNIVGQGQATSLLITLANALEGEPIDVSEPGDSDADGLSDSDSTHTLVLTYMDKNQVVRDAYWTNIFIGQNDGDDLLESGEKVELNVRLTGLSNPYPVTGDTRFDLEIRAESGGSIVVERTMPDLIDTVMNLN
jgi:archaellin